MKKIIDWLLPHYCIVCGLIATGEVCLDCLSELPRNQQCCLTCAQELKGTIKFQQCGECLIAPPPFDLTVILFKYQFPIPSLITKLKFSQKIRFAAPLGSLLGEHVLTVYQEMNRALPRVILPVPLSNKRLKQRGYNQAMEIARPISKLLNVPIDYKNLSRTRSTLPQTLITPAERQVNVKNAFHFKNKLQYKHVAVVDDVVTTFSTLAAITLELKKGGVELIDTWCLAKA